MKKLTKKQLEKRRKDLYCCCEKCLKEDGIDLPSAESCQKKFLEMIREGKSFSFDVGSGGKG